MIVVAFRPDRTGERDSWCPVAVAASALGVGGAPLYDTTAAPKGRYLAVEEAEEAGVCGFGVNSRWAVIVNHTAAACNAGDQSTSLTWRRRLSKAASFAQRHSTMNPSDLESNATSATASPGGGGRRESSAQSPSARPASPRRATHYPFTNLGREYASLWRGRNPYSDPDTQSSVAADLQVRQTLERAPPTPAGGFLRRSTVLPGYLTGGLAFDRATRDVDASVETQAIAMILKEMGLEGLLVPLPKEGEGVPAAAGGGVHRQGSRAALRGGGGKAMAAAAADDGAKPDKARDADNTNERDPDAPPSRNESPGRRDRAAGAGAAGDHRKDRGLVTAASSAALATTARDPHKEPLQDGEHLDILLGNANYAYHFDSRARKIAPLEPGWHVFADAERGFRMIGGDVASLDIREVFAKETSGSLRSIAGVSTAAYSLSDRDASHLDFNHTLFGKPIDGADPTREVASEVRYRLPVHTLDADTHEHRSAVREALLAATEGRRRRGRLRLGRGPA